MKRFFISKHPTVGRSKSPVAQKIEQSPYYFWWLALTLNEKYLDLCAGASKGTKVEDSQLSQVFADFGDVRYDGDKYKAFANWWRRKANDTETMGEYLFSEPVAATKVMLVDDAEAANNLQMMRAVF